MSGVSDSKFQRVEYTFNDFKNAVGEKLGNAFGGTLDKNLSEVQSIFDAVAKNDGGKSDELLEVNNLFLERLVNKAAARLMHLWNKENKDTSNSALKNQSTKNWQELTKKEIERQQQREMKLLDEEEAKLENEKKEVEFALRLFKEYGMQKGPNETNTEYIKRVLDAHPKGVELQE